MSQVQGQRGQDFDANTILQERRRQTAGCN